MKGRKTSKGRETILLVEDDRSLVYLTKSLLEERGYKVLLAWDGEEALDIYREHKNEIAVIITDMGLPKLGGWEVFKSIKEIDPKAKVILVSGYVDQKLKAEMMSAGAADFVQKPYDPYQIAKKIRRMIDAR